MKSNAFITYLRESYEEFKRVTWPTRNQAIRLSGIVLSFVLASAVIIAVLDYGFNMGYQYLLNLR
ncbi:MAG: preprotein translocase subunit SecE [Candidatus Peregrinibacteria bacterium]|nr:preprotein translocase subunit SecE [Candidatus Peregrinibacteria bacterium]